MEFNLEHQLSRLSLNHSIWLGLQAHKISISTSLVHEKLDPLESRGFNNDCKF